MGEGISLFEEHFMDPLVTRPYGTSKARFSFRVITGRELPCGNLK